MLVDLQNVCINVSNVSKLVKLLTASKPACVTIVIKGNICNVIIVSQHH